MHPAYGGSNHCYKFVTMKYVVPVTLLFLLLISCVNRPSEKQELVFIRGATLLNLQDTAVALHYLDGFLNNYRKSLAHADLFFEQITKNDKIQIKKLAEGTNVVELKLKDHSPGQLQKSLALHQIHIPDGDEKTGKVFLKINPSILRRSPEELAEVFNSLSLQDGAEH